MAIKNNKQLQNFPMPFRDLEIRSEDAEVEQVDINRLIINQATLDARSAQIMAVGAGVRVIFRKAPVKPLRPTGGSILNNKLMPPDGWDIEIPVGDDPLWGAIATYSYTGELEYSEPFLLQAVRDVDADERVNNSTMLSRGSSAGQHGTSYIFIFTRNSVTPSTPAGGTINKGRLTTPPTGWSISVPVGTDHLYMAGVTIPYKGRPIYTAPISLGTGSSKVVQTQEETFLQMDTILQAGSNVVLTPDGTTFTIEINSVATGDITEVIAGTGLSGGGMTGAVTLDIDTPFTVVEQTKLSGIEVGAQAHIAPTQDEVYDQSEVIFLEGANVTLTKDSVANTITVTSTAAKIGDITSVIAGVGLDGGGNMGDITLNVTNPFTVAEKTKLATIEDSATIDQTPMEIKDALETLAGTQRLDAAAIRNLAAGNIASIVAGTGLIGGGTSGNITLAVQTPYTTTQETKLAGIEIGATADQPAAEIKLELEALTGTARLEAAAIKDLITSIVPGTGLSGGGTSGDVTLTISEPYTAAERTKLAGSDANAADDQTAGEIRAALETLTAGDRLDASAIQNLQVGDITAIVAGTGLTGGGNIGDVTLNVGEPYTAAERTKLSGIEVASTADQTAVEIRDALVSLTTTDRLDAAAVQNIPQGDITQVIAGVGLTGGGTTGDVTLTVSEPYTAAERTKLAAIEASATVDQTPTEIKDALETLSGTSRLDANAIQNLPAAGGAGDITTVTAGTGLSGGGTSGDVTLTVTTPYTAAEQTKLSGIEARATTDQTAVEIRDALGTLTAANRLDASHIQNIPMGDITTVTAGTGLTGGGSSGDVTLTISEPYTAAERTKLAGSATGATANVGDITGVAAGTGLSGGGNSGDVTLTVEEPYTAAERTKLATIEASATADQTGAEMKTALETLAGAARLDANAIQNIPAGDITAVIAGSGLAGGGSSGSVTLDIQNPYTNVEKTKLAGVEASATADQTSIEIKTALESLAGTARLDAAAIKNLPAGDITTVTAGTGLSGGGTSGDVTLTISEPYTAAERTKLSGIATGATANVGDITEVAAGTGLSGGGTSGDVTLTVTTPYTSTEQTKLSAIEASATADQTGAEIKTVLETLSGVARLEASAIQNLPSGGTVDSAAIIAAVEGTPTDNQIIEYDITNTRLKFVDPSAGGAGDITAVIAGTGLSGGGNSGDVTLTVTTPYTAAEQTKLSGIATGATANTGDITTVTAGTGLSGGGTSGDVTLTISEPYTAAERTKLSGIEVASTADQTGVEIKDALETLAGIARLDVTAVQNVPSGDITEVDAGTGLGGGGTSGAISLHILEPYSSAEKIKLAGIETNATVDQTGNEIKTALESLAGAARLDGAAIKNLPAGDITTVTAGTGLSGGGSSGDVTLTISEPYTAAERTKLATIEASATADQTAAEMKIALETLSGVARLDASAIQNLPGSTAGDITTVTAGTGLTGGGTSGDVTLTISEPYTAAERTKLAGSDANAADDQTPTEIKDALETLAGSARLDASAIQNIPAGDITEVVAGSGLAGGGSSNSVTLDIQNPYTNVEKTKLAGVETSATADQTAIEIRVLLETLAGTARLDAAAIKNLTAGGAGDITTVTAGTGLSGGGTSGDVTLSVTTPYTAAERTKLGAIETSATADQTATEIKSSLEGLTGTGRLLASAIQNLPSGGTVDSAAIVSAVSGTPSDSQIIEYDTTNSRLQFVDPPTGSGAGDITGVTAGTGLSGGGRSGSVTLTVDEPYTAAERLKLHNIAPGATANIGNIWGITAGTGLSGGGRSGTVTLSVTTPYTVAEQTKLSGIATGATANVGDITEVGAGTGLSGGGTSGDVTLTVTTPYTSAEQTKLSGIEADAQVVNSANIVSAVHGTPTDGQIVAYDTANTRLEFSDPASGTGSFTSAEKTKLSGIETGAQVVSSANITLAVEGTPTDGQTIKYDAANTRLLFTDSVTVSIPSRYTRYMAVKATIDFTASDFLGGTSSDTATIISPIFTQNSRVGLAIPQSRPSLNKIFASGSNQFPFFIKSNTVLDINGTSYVFWYSENLLLVSGISGEPFVLGPDSVTSTNTINGNTIRDALLTLTGGARLDASAIKNLPRTVTGDIFNGNSGYADSTTVTLSNWAATGSMWIEFTEEPPTSGNGLIVFSVSRKNGNNENRALSNVIPLNIWNNIRDSNFINFVSTQTNSLAFSNTTVETIVFNIKKGTTNGRHEIRTNSTDAEIYLMIESYKFA